MEHFLSFKLYQSTRTHHEFEVILPHDAFEEAQNHQLEETQQFLGKKISVFIRYRDTLGESPERAFVGVITKVAFSQERGNIGNVVLTGKSPTVLLDGAPHTQSFGGSLAVNTGIIAEDILHQGLPQDYEFRVEPNFRGSIPYSAQYQETHYNYLCRMAEAYGEQFYYDGEVLHFGRLPPQNTPLELIYGSNVSDIRVELNAVHTRPEYYGYNSSKDAQLTSAETPVKHKGDLAKTAYLHNGSIYRTKSLQAAPIRAQTDKDVEYSQQSAAGSAGVSVFSVSANTSIPFLYPGCVCDLEMRKPDSSRTSYFTRIMVTDAWHEVDAVGHYTGSFRAIASDTGFLPKPEFTVPVAQPQLATVTANADPQGQGRVKVRFHWQLHDTTGWIRVMAPDAGGTDQVTQNRGYVAIPEVGDQVMVGFVHNHPDRPFVMGGMFHGQVGLGGGSENRVKSIMTRSGHKVIFTEDESIIITDKSGNEIHMDTTGSNINITAPETMTLNCKNMNINVAENMTSTIGMDQSTSVGQNQRNTVGQNITESAGMNKTSSIGMLNMLSVGTDFITNVVGKMTEFIQGNKESHTEKDRTRITNGKVNSQSNGMHEFHSDKEVQNNSGEKSKNY